MGQHGSSDGSMGSSTLTPALVEVTESPLVVQAVVPRFDSGNVTMMMVASALVLFMSAVGLPAFYGGMARAKNVISTVTQSVVIFSLVLILWVIYGYSLAFTAWTPVIGGLGKVMLVGVGLDAAVGTFSKGVMIPELVSCLFQATFAGVTTALIAGGYAERMKFKAVLAFSTLWFTFSYLPIAHMVWCWAGPDAYSSAAVMAAQNATAGWLWQLGTLDFAGGNVVHINAGIAGLICAEFLGRRLGYGSEEFTPYSTLLSAFGAVCLWFGWIFGFNAGSNLEASSLAVLAALNSLLATAAGGLAWLFVEFVLKRRWSLFGWSSGAIAGLVGITPACGYVGLCGALLIGMLCGVACYFACTSLKRAAGYDDAFDVFGVHAFAGIIGAILTGVFVNPALGGTGYVTDWVTMSVGYSWWQVVTQIEAVLVTMAWSSLVTTGILLLLQRVMGDLRVTTAQEIAGLDLAEHGEGV